MGFGANSTAIRKSGGMKSLPNIFKFLAIFLACYLTITALSYVKPVRQAVVPVYNVFQKATFNMMHPKIRTDFTSFDSKANGTDEYDYSIHIQSAEEYKKSRNKSQVHTYVITNQNARLTAFGPFIMLLSLVLASPISWKRKLLSFALGSSVVFFLLAMKYTALFDGNLDNSMTALKDPNSIWINISKFLNDAFRTNEFLALIIIPIWALTSFRTKDWKWFIQ